jgi:predicted glycosyl hydrolase (DUF1957 family)
MRVAQKAQIIDIPSECTKAAEEENAENLLIIISKELANIYIDNWMKHKEYSEEYRGKIIKSMAERFEKNTVKFLSCPINAVSMQTYKTGKKVA